MAFNCGAGSTVFHSSSVTTSCANSGHAFIGASIHGPSWFGGAHGDHTRNLNPGIRQVKASKPRSRKGCATLRIAERSVGAELGSSR
jgi:hypothetical protein